MTMQGESSRTVISEPTGTDKSINEVPSGSIEDKITHLFARQNLHEVPAERLNVVPPEERIAALQDLHGVSDVIEETPDLRTAKIQAMAKLLSELKAEDEEAKAYFVALSLNPDYVASLRVVCLRAEKWDETKAVRRMVRHFEVKSRLFQRTDLLARPILLSDMEANKDDTEALVLGLAQLLPRSDQVGRAIICLKTRGAGEHNHPLDSVLRVLFWISSVAALQYQDIQTKGIVGVWYGVGHQPNTLFKGRGLQMFSTFPALLAPVVAIHVCFDSPRVKPILDSTAAKIESNFLLRFVSHYGSNVECRFNLVAFGIPSDSLPVHADGTWHVRDHQLFLERQRAREASRDANARPSKPTVAPDGESEEVEPPKIMDIIMGRGNRGREWPGNLRLKTMLESYYHRYDISTRLEKTTISRRIYMDLIEQGCRFLSPHPTRGKDKNIWIEVGETAARDRIGHGFRNLRVTKR